MRRAKISELKAQLSAFLAAVRAGETVVVCDRNTPIARLVPFDEDLESFRVEPPTKPVGDLRSLRPVPLLRPIDLDRLLRDSRDVR
jgi:prevent-host-death family protein